MERYIFIRHKYFPLAVGLVSLFICYELAFKRTIEAWSEHRQLAHQLNEAIDVTTNPGYLLRKSNNLKHIISSYRLDSVTFHNNSVNTITELAEQEQVKAVTVPADDAVYHSAHFNLQKMAFEGDFFALLKLVDKLQHTSGIGLLRSLSWKKTKTNEEHKSATGTVILEIYMAVDK